MVNKMAAIRREDTTDTIISRLVTNPQLGTRKGRPYKRSWLFMDSGPLTITAGSTKHFWSAVATLLQ